MIFLAILEPIERPLRAILEWLHTAIGLPWAWAIIALTLLVRLVILPLTIKQIRSMQHLQQHAPELKAIQQKYKNDRQRMNEEVMKFYRENKINPAASCFPLLIQFPVFIALYYVLRGFEKTVAEKYPGSDLGWLNVVPNITDNITAHWSGWLLVAVYVASQLASIISMPMTDPRQRWVFIALPFVFIIFIVNATFPVGLLLYWVTTNLWTVGQGLVTRRMFPKPPPPPKRTSRTPPKAAPTGDGGGPAKSVQPSRATQPGQQRVRRRKKKGPRSRR
ncbi:MAG TPA: YidC/Oxa1 family membrane protein insertase [Gaiellaceae bacterium]|nr:YidC/Oxa1 family membrane protein insertase [Gaiellaceae bacterium]